MEVKQEPKIAPLKPYFPIDEKVFDLIIEAVQSIYETKKRAAFVLDI